MTKIWLLKPEYQNPAPISAPDETPAEYRERQALIPANDNIDYDDDLSGQTKQRRPTLFEAKRNRLMPTPEMNRAAEAVLITIDQLVSASTPPPFQVSEDRSVNGWSWEAERDMGPSPEQLIRQWTAGPPANSNVIHLTGLLATALGKSDILPCAPVVDVTVAQETEFRKHDLLPNTPAVVLATVRAVPIRRKKRNKQTGVVERKSRKPVRQKNALVQVGTLRFTPKGHVIPSDWRGDDWIRGPRGKGKKAPVNSEPDNIVHISHYRGAAHPRLGVEFLADAVTENKLAHIQPMNCPLSAWQTADAAQNRLRLLRVRLGPEKYEALLDAACGVEVWRIGNGKSARDWRAAALGKALVVEALKILCETNRA